MRDSTGKCAFEYIRDYEEWIQSGNFSPDIISVMRSKHNIVSEDFGYIYNAFLV